MVDTTGALERTPFAQVDELPAPIRAMLLAALEGMAATPEIGEVRRVADAALRPAPGQAILDAGCGAGEVARQLAAIAGPDGQVTAIDTSRTTIEHAEAHDGGAGVQYQVADVMALPFDDGGFDAVRCERVLQHLADPDAGVAELTRVTRPGGRVCLIDTDWRSLASDGLPDDLVQAVTDALLNRGTLHHPTMGRTLRRRLVQAGLKDVSAQPVTLSFTEPARAAAILPMFNPLVPPEARMMPDDVRKPWFDAIETATTRNEFLAVLTIWVAVGTMPGRAAATDEAGG